MSRVNPIPLPYASVAELRTAYDFGNLQAFLDIYYAVAEILRDADDFYHLALGYMQLAHTLAGTFSRITSLWNVGWD